MISDNTQWSNNHDTHALIGFNRVTKSFATKEDARIIALDGVTFSIAPNEFFTLLGPSGCGKTTLLRLIAGFESPDIGAVHLDGHDITRLPANRRPINTVFQSYQLFPHMAVAQNVNFGQMMLGKPRSVIDRVTGEMLELVKLENMSDRKPSQLSGGQQQRVALARALAPEPRVLLLDEPLSALDLKLRKEMQIEMKRIQRDSHTTFIFVTHDQEEAVTMSDRIAVMDHGRVQQIGAPSEIYEHPANTFVAAFIGDMNFIDVHRVLNYDVGTVVADTPVGQLTAKQPKRQSTVSDKSPVRIAFRPEHCQISLSEAPGANNEIPVKIVDIVFKGPYALVFLLVRNCDHEIRARISADKLNYESYEIGSTATLSLPAEQLAVLDS